LRSRAKFIAAYGTRAGRDRAGRPVSFSAMTVPLRAPDGSDQRPGSQAPGHVEPIARPQPGPPPSAPEAVAALCPYLTSAGGSWRQATPSREHRCGALDPPAPQPTEKQRRHCLSADHVECAIFRAARDARAAALAPIGGVTALAAIDAARRPLARTSPILLERPTLVEQAVRLPFDRASGQIALVALMILAFGIVAITRLSAGSVGPASPSPSQIAVAPSPSPTPIPTPTPSVEPSASASASAEPSFRTTYTVKKGDTLSAIAKRFKTTTTVLRRLNHLTSNTIHTGEVVKIP
jgi:hypothetical protein